MIKIITPNYKTSKDDVVINTTSHSMTWSKSLSPFFVGPIKLYGEYNSINMENAWQYSKVYGHLDHVDEKDNPTESYFKWAQQGWKSIRANRYPMGKGIKPLFSYWDGKKLSYTEARKQIYVPLYANAVKQTNAFEKLKGVYKNTSSRGEILHLVDFDAHNMPPGSFKYEDFLDNPEIKVGHAYVLAMLLEGVI